MIPRLCLQQSIKTNTAKPCSFLEILELTRTEYIRDICAKIETETDPEERALLKKQLPAITPHACRFDDNKRSNSAAHPSGFVMLDIDHIADPLALFREQVAPKIIACKIVLVHKTPSGHGLRIIAERPFGSTIEQAQADLAKALQISTFDPAPKDLARLSFLPAFEFIFYFASPETFEWTPEQAALWDEPTAPTATEIPATLPDLPPTFDGTPIDRIVQQLILLLGGNPQVGERNSLYFALATNLRYICDFRADNLLALLPSFGLSEAERQTAIKSAISRPRRTQMPDLLQRAIVQAADDLKAATDPEETPDTDTPLEIPKLPRLLTLLCRNLPPDFQPAMLVAALPILGTLATAIRFKYLDNNTHSLSFFSCITAPAATGKSFIRTPVSLLLRPIDEQDEIERDKDQKFKEALRRAKNSKQQPEDPKACPRHNGINISIAKLLQLMTYANGRHLIGVAEEIDTILKSEKAGTWSQKSDIYRLAFDNAVYGQMYMSENSFSANVPVFYNVLITGTPGAAYRFFKDVEDGLVTRVAFATLPDMFAAEMPVFKPYTKAEETFIVESARLLMQAQGEISCPMVAETIAQWLEEKRQIAIQTDSRAVDTLRRRSGVIGFRAGMLCFVINQQKIPLQAARFARYMAEYVFRQQMKLFGSKFEQLEKEEEQTAAARGAVRSLLDQLPPVFSRTDLIAVRRKAGQSTQIQTVLHRWKKAGLIEPIGAGEFKKVGINGPNPS